MQLKSSIFQKILIFPEIGTVSGIWNGKKVPQPCFSVKIHVKSYHTEKEEQKIMKKYFAVLLALSMLAAVLAGCAYERADAWIDADGSGSVTVTFGFSEELIEACDLYQEIKAADFAPFSYNGRTYYGDSATEKFADPAEFNAIFRESSASMEESGVADMGTVTLSQNGDESLTLTVLFGGETGAADALEDTADAHDVELTAAEKAALLDGMVAVYEFTFPQEIRQISGGSKGVTVDGSSLRFDLLEMELGAYRFTTAEAAQQTTPVIPQLTPMTIPASGTARARTQNIAIDGRTIQFQTYALVDANGGETNFVKLRDVAYAMNGTAAQFGVDWDGSVLLVPGVPYQRNGSEMKTPFSGDRAYVKASAATKLYGQSVPFTAIMLTDDQGGGYTYYKLRDLGQVLGFDVSWSEARGIYIDSDKPYTAD